MVQFLVSGAIVVVCTLLIIIILLQKGRGGGLTAAFGGGGSGSAFGAKTGDVFTWITVTFAALYLILNVVGNFVFRQTITASTPGITAPLGAETATADPQAGAQTDQATGAGDVDIDTRPITAEDEAAEP